MNLGNRSPHFQGVTDDAQGFVPDQFQRIDTAENSGPFGAEGILSEWEMPLDQLRKQVLAAQQSGQSSIESRR